MEKFEYYKPETLKEASELLVKIDNSYIFNGGTDIVVLLKNGLIKPNSLVDIKEIDGLDEITSDKNGVVVGACANMNKIANDKYIISDYSLLSDSIHYAGSGQVRNLATMIGNICNASPLADTATPLLVYKAVVLVYSIDGEREIPIDEFFKGVRKIALEKGEIVTGVRIPKYDSIVGTFNKVSRRREVDLSTVCSTVAKLDGEIRIAFGSVAPIPLRAKKAEEFLKGKELTDEIIVKASKIARDDVSPIDDIRASKKYRLDMVELSVLRGLEHIKAN